MKYEMIFGDEGLFDNAIGDSVAAINHGDVVYCFNSYNAFLIEVMKCNDLPLSDVPEFAMRRIIPEPKRWTLEDKDAGRLPDVGSRIFVPLMQEEQNVIYTSKNVIISISDSDGAVTRTEVKSIDRINPIETPEEKAKRLEDEFINYVLHHEKSQINSSEELVAAKRAIKLAYKLQLSGELPMPKKGG